MKIRQSDVAKLERREDVLLSTLRRYIRALGGTLEIFATLGTTQVRVRAPGETRGNLNKKKETNMSKAKKKPYLNRVGKKIVSVKAEKKSRRTFSTSQKLALVQDYDAAMKGGKGGEFLTTNALYSSTLGAWRKILKTKGLYPVKPASKPAPVTTPIVTEEVAEAVGGAPSALTISELRLEIHRLKEEKKEILASRDASVKNLEEALAESSKESEVLARMYLKVKIEQENADS